MTPHPISQGLVAQALEQPAKQGRRGQRADHLASGRIGRFDTERDLQGLRDRRQIGEHLMEQRPQIDGSQCRRFGGRFQTGQGDRIVDLALQLQRCGQGLARQRATQRLGRRGVGSQQAQHAIQ